MSFLIYLVPALPFGGVGASGLGGSSHGKSGFMAFTHRRPAHIRKTDALLEKLQEVRYPPLAFKPIAKRILNLFFPTSPQTFLYALLTGGGSLAGGERGTWHVLRKYVIKIFVIWTVWRIGVTKGKKIALKDVMTV